MASFLAVVEEVMIASDVYSSVRQMRTQQGLLNGVDEDQNPLKFEDISTEEKVSLMEFYDSVDLLNERKMMLMARESSIQLVYQQALLLYQFVYAPLLELDFTKTIIQPSSAKWMLGLALQVLSIALSANSTFSPIIQNAQFHGFKGAVNAV